MAAFPDTADIAFDKTQLPPDGRREPALAFAMAAAGPIGATERGELGFRPPPLRTKFDQIDGKTAPALKAPSLPSPIPAGELRPSASATGKSSERRLVGDDLRPPRIAARRRLAPGPLASLLLHASPLLMLLAWPHSPVEITQSIPIRLVLEPPPAPPAPPKPKPEPAPAPGRRASDDFAETQAPTAERGSEVPTTPREPQALALAAPIPAPAPVRAEPAPDPEKPAANEAQAPPPQAAAPQPPEHETRLVLVAPLAQPAPLEEPLPTAPLPPPAENAASPVPPHTPPKSSPRKEPAVMRMPEPPGSEWPLPLHQSIPEAAARTAPRVGPTATRDEYCAYALELMLRHLDLLPLSYIGARRGMTVLTIRVLADGKINSMRISRSSGYSDIDERVEKMVIAVGRLPPLPQWIQGQWMDFTFQLHFPHPLQH